MGQPGFWENQDLSKTTMKEVKTLQKTIAEVEGIEASLGDTKELCELMVEEEDESSQTELSDELQSLAGLLNALEIRGRFTDPKDERNAILTVHPGAGGTESCDWASMLLRMYIRWLERHEFTFEMVDYLDGDEAGIKRATLMCEGEYAYGRLKAERGVHRLVRISPFDANSRRHTSFAAVEVLAEVTDDVEIEIGEKDLRIDTFRASGPGGQHVNKTSSAVRITHLPTNTVSQCQSERSQHRNKATAMTLLRAKLYDMKMQEKQEEADKERGQQSKIAWGSQIRSYVLHPYQMVKDHRTDHETHDIDALLDGNLDPFIEAFLLWSAKEAHR
jgi:peptide chain release factor 2